MANTETGFLLAAEDDVLVSSTDSFAFPLAAASVSAFNKSLNDLPLPERAENPPVPANALKPPLVMDAGLIGAGVAGNADFPNADPPRGDGAPNVGFDEGEPEDAAAPNADGAPNV